MYETQEQRRIASRAEDKRLIEAALNCHSGVYYATLQTLHGYEFAPIVLLR